MKKIYNFQFTIYKKGFIQHHLSRVMNLKKRIHLVASGAGFTLIELLVAIAIIGILSSFLLANFVGVRQRARDGVRKSDLRQIQSALELYRADQGKYLPTTTLACGSALTSGGVLSPANIGANTVYMRKIPCDPSTSESYSYGPEGDTSYSLTACLENSSDSQKDSPPNQACASQAGVSYTVTNP